MREETAQRRRPARTDQSSEPALRRTLAPGAREGVVARAADDASGVGAVGSGRPATGSTAGVR